MGDLGSVCIETLFLQLSHSGSYCGCCNWFVVGFLSYGMFLWRHWILTLAGSLPDRTETSNTTQNCSFLPSVASLHLCHLLVIPAGSCFPYFDKYFSLPPEAFGWIWQEFDDAAGWKNNAVGCPAHQTRAKCPKGIPMKRIKAALWRPQLKFLSCMSNVVGTAAESVKGKDSLCPC